MFKATVSKTGDLIELSLEDGNTEVTTTISPGLAERLGLALISIAKAGSEVTDEALHHLIDNTPPKEQQQ